MSWLERLFSRRSSSPASPRTGASAPSAPSAVLIDGAQLPVATTPEAFCALIAHGGRGVLRFPTRQYGALLAELMRLLEGQYGRDAPQTRELFSALLVCAGCMWQFPPSYILFLQGIGGAIPKMAGATRGADTFAATGACTQCGATECLLVYDAVPADGVTAADVDAIRDYWRDQAVSWWASQSRTTAICDQCNEELARGKGYLMGSSLICEECVGRSLLQDGLAQLQRDPNYYGNGLLRKARAFRR